VLFRNSYGDLKRLLEDGYGIVDALFIHIYMLVHQMFSNG